jgi:hypothetical protein
MSAKPGQPKTLIVCSNHTAPDQNQSYPDAPGSHPCLVMWMQSVRLHLQERRYKVR